MAATNDITGDAIASRVTTDAFRNNYDAIFGKKEKKDNRSWVICKHGTNEEWPYYWDNNPNDGIIQENSAFHTHTGKTVGIEMTYDNHAKALRDCEKMNHHNPSGYYAVVPQVVKKDTQI